jgi:hypothetical protein
MEGRGALHAVQGAPRILRQKEQLYLGGQLILARLSGHDHGEGEAASIER